MGCCETREYPSSMHCSHHSRSLQSRIKDEGGLPTKKESYITWNDEMIDEVKLTLKACKLFLFIPVYLVADVGLDNVIANQGNVAPV